MADERFDRFMGDSDGIMWTIERDPLLRSTIVAVLLLERAAEWPAVLARAEEAARRIPRLRQRVVETPLRLAPPRFVVDPDFAVTRHVSRVGAPPPGDLDAVLGLAGTAAERPFLGDRPPWELVVVEGMADGAAACILKVHHAITDGVGGMRLLAMFVDHDGAAIEPLPALPPAEHRSRPGVAIDGALHTVRQAAGAGLGFAGRALGTAGRVVRDPRRAATDLAALGRSVVRVLAPTTATLSPLTRARSTGRRVAVLEYPLGELRTAAHAAGGTLNDAFVAAIAGGLRRYHERHGVEVAALRMTMPISTRGDGDPLGGNRLMPARFPVPIGETDPATRVRDVGRVCRAACAEPALPVTDAIAAVLDHLPAPLTTRVFGSMLEHVDFLATNVPGAPQPIRLLGAEVRRLWALAPPMGAALNVSLISHVDVCCVGITTDAAAVPDHAVLLECLRAGFAEILALAHPGENPRMRPEATLTVGS